jgi:methylated-DNA-[protein]-cysteine S-methyltransferase
MKSKASEIRARIFKTAWGWCAIGVTGKGLARLVIPEGRGKEELAGFIGGAVQGGSRRAAKAITDYFAGRVRAFKIPVDFAGLTSFERAVCSEVAKIPYGRTRSYGDIARRIGRPGAARAVGTAVAKNPLPIVIPCHRVVRSDGGLGGFSSRAGVATKKKLLDFEKRNKGQTQNYGAQDWV